LTDGDDAGSTKNASAKVLWPNAWVFIASIHCSCATTGLVCTVHASTRNKDASRFARSLNRRVPLGRPVITDHGEQRCHNPKKQNWLEKAVAEGVSLKSRSEADCP